MILFFTKMQDKKQVNKMLQSRKKEHLTYTVKLAGKCSLEIRSFKKKIVKYVLSENIKIGI